MPPLKIIPGMKFGEWEVIERDYHPKSKQHSTFWFCRCGLCGEIISVSRDSLVKGKSGCCNKCKGEKIKNTQEERGITKHIINIGDTFGLLTALSRPYHRADRSHGSYVKCQCACGNIVEVSKKHLIGPQTGRNGRTISCGCASQSSGEIKIAQLLTEANIDFQTQYRIKEFNILSPFDFAIFKENKLLGLIEYDGQQHFEAVELWGGEKQLKIQQERDERKNQWCQENNIRLIRISYTEYDNLTIEYLFSFFPELSSSEIEN